MIAMDLIRQTSQRIARGFSPEKIILFGSYAHGTPADDSDVDLMVLLPFEGKALDKTVEILTAVDPPFPVDVIVSRPGDAARRYTEGDPLVRDAMDRGIVLYEQRR